MLIPIIFAGIAVWWIARTPTGYQRLRKNVPRTGIAWIILVFGSLLLVLAVWGKASLLVQAISLYLFAGLCATLPVVMVLWFVTTITGRHKNKRKRKLKVSPGDPNAS